MLNFQRSFLLSRMQRSILNGKCSKWELISSGASQESILGPILAYINGLTDNVNYLMKLLADETLFLAVCGEANTAYR